MSATTKQRVQVIIEKAVESGQSIGTTTATLRKDYAFSAEKAKVIARTETARALGVGVKEAAIHQGRDEKRWITSGDIEELDVCVENADMGWIPIADEFSEGLDTVPAHPNCRCNVRYRTAALEADVVVPRQGVDFTEPEKGLNVSPEFRCIKCNHLLGRDVSTGTRILCRHCKAERIAS